MLSPADDDMVRREVELPGLRVLLDEEAFLGALRRLNPEVEFTAARLGYLRHKPATNCLAAYTVRTGGQDFGVYGKASRVWDKSKWLKHGLSAARAGGLGWVGGCLPDQALVLSVFPHDAHLDSLARWMDPTWRREFLERHEIGRPFAEDRGFEVLNYKPERRWVGRWVAGNGGHAAVVKVYSETGFGAALAAARTARRGSRYDVPRLLARSRSRRTLVLDWREGTRLDLGLSHGEPDRGVARDVGAGLAEFHRQSLGNSALPDASMDRLVGDLTSQAEWIGWLMPSLGETARRLADRLRSEVGSVVDPNVVVHGDFHPGQVLWQPGGVVFLDMDDLRIGPAWLDLTRFLAHLEGEVIRGAVAGSAAASVAEAFLGGYDEVAGASSGERLRGRVGAQMFMQAATGYRYRHPNWAENLVRLLERVRELLDEGVGRSPGSRQSTVGTARDGGPDGVGVPVAAAGCDVVNPVVMDPAMPFLDQALRVDWMDRRLRRRDFPAADALAEHALTAARLIRHKRGRRGLIHYEFCGASLPGGFSWLGKVRARRVSGWGQRVASALRNAGMDDRSWAAVPEPLGVVEELHMELQRRVCGDEVTGRLDPACEDRAGISSRCANAVRRMHDSGVVIGREHTVGDEVAILRARLERLHKTHPEWMDRVNRLVEGCGRLAAGLPEVRPCLIHRDFYPAQVLIDGSRTWLLDLDLATMGDPCVDHGNFLAHLVEWSVRRWGRPDALAEWEAAYRASILPHAGALAEMRLDAYLTLSLARHVQICTEFPDRRAWMPNLLEICEARLDLGRAPL